MAELKLTPLSSHTRFLGILTHFDTRLNRLERTILPLHNSTQSLTRLSNSACISSLAAPAGAGRSSNPSSRPRLSPSVDIDATLAALSSVRVNQEKTMSDEAALMSP